MDKTGKFFIHTQEGLSDFVRIKKSGTEFKALIPEQRNDENVIISQLQLFWQQLHNVLMDHYTNDALEARRMVTQLFQIIVIEEFLRYIIRKNTYINIFEKNQKYLELYELPDYFTKASFRFGHSIIRMFYTLDGQKKFNLKTLFKRGKKLDTNHVIDWSFFFSKHKQKTVSLDTKISSPMFKIPGASTSDVPVQIAEKNIQACIDAGLASGHEFTQALIDQNPKIVEEMSVRQLKNLNGASFDSLSINGVALEIKDIPLWPYLLLEAQQSEASSKLGPLGSLLNAEVLRWSIEGAEFSVFSGGEYHFSKAIANLGNLGKAILSAHEKYREDNTSQLSMISLINFTNNKRMP